MCVCFSFNLSYFPWFQLKFPLRKAGSDLSGRVSQPSCPCYSVCYITFNQVMMSFVLVLSLPCSMVNCFLPCGAPQHSLKRLGIDTSWYWAPSLLPSLLTYSHIALSRADLVKLPCASDPSETPWCSGAAARMENQTLSPGIKGASDLALIFLPTSPHTPALRLWANQPLFDFIFSSVLR